MDAGPIPEESLRDVKNVKSENAQDKRILIVVHFVMIIHVNFWRSILPMIQMQERGLKPYEAEVSCSWQVL